MDCVPELPSQSVSGPLLDHLRLAWISGKRAANPPNLAHKEAMHTQIGVGFRAFWAHPSPTPYVDPIPPKVTQCHPRPGSPTRAVFAWWGGRLRESAGSQRLIRYQIQFFAASCQLLVANCSIVKDRSHLGCHTLADSPYRTNSERGQWPS
jgi:hypothetical protein